jgi:8-oxo-dGTP pyrophosphatase MutT (NUDIX family)
MNTNIPISIKAIIFEGNKIWLRLNERKEWELPGGKIDSKEQPRQAIIREIYEELGFNISIKEIVDASVYTIESISSPNKILLVTYACDIMSKTGSFEYIGEAGYADFKAFEKKDLNNINLPNIYREIILREWH